MNVIEKILAQASGNKEVRPGDVVVANVDLMVMHDLSSNFVMKVFENEMENARIADPSRVVFAFDHNFAPATQAAAEALAAVRKFAAKHGIKHVFDCGCGSVHHAIIESGLWKPGQVIIGCDSHTPIYGALGVFATGVGNNSMAALGFQHSLGWFRIPETIQIFFHGETGPAVTPRDISQYVVGRIGEDGAIYKALEYAGPWMQSLPVEDRMLFPLQSIDVGGKCGFINPDEKTIAFARAFSNSKDFDMPANDPGTKYTDVLEIDVSKIEPQIACPPTVGNVRPVEEAVGIPVNIAEVGGSTGGRIEDIRAIARYFANRKVHPDVRPADCSRVARRLQCGPAGRSVPGPARRRRQHLPAQRGFQSGV